MVEIGSVETKHQLLIQNLCKNKLFVSSKQLAQLFYYTLRETSPTTTFFPKTTTYKPHKFIIEIENTRVECMFMWKTFAIHIKCTLM